MTFRWNTTTNRHETATVRNGGWTERQEQNGKVTTNKTIIWPQAHKINTKWWEMIPNRQKDHKEIEKKTEN